MNCDPADPRAAVWLAVAQLCGADTASFSPAFVDALSQVVYAQAAPLIETMAADLECFAKHAKRAKISVDDVKLCARRNPDVLAALSPKTS